MTMVASRVNGKAAGVLDLGDLAPEKRPIKAQRDGKPVTLWGYVEGKRCPGFVRTALFRAQDGLRALDADATPSERDQVLYEHLRDTVLAVIEGLEFEEAEVRAGNPDEVHAILRYLGWEDDEAEAADDSPEGLEEAAAP